MEEPFLYYRLTPREFLFFIGNIYGIEQKTLYKRISCFLEKFAMTQHADKLISTLSHGTKQKVALSAALIHKPLILFLDEPFSGLDPQSLYNFKEELKKITARGGAVLIATHIMEVAQTISNRVGIINQGRQLACGTIEELQKEFMLDTENLEEIFLAITS
ncbi:MAG: ABC transporter ATP-binding protein [Deltaproteobacteria bacterium]|nr:ABC transporter ATP-binding protein [Deltaproteobacteria bacterium]